MQRKFYALFTRKLPVFLIPAAVVLCVGFAFSPNLKETLSIGKLSYGSMKYEPFRIITDSDISISGRAVSSPDKRVFYAYGWIIDADTREIVWKMEFDNAESVEQLSSGYDAVNYHEYITLAAGYYELHYYTGSPSTSQTADNTKKYLGKFFKKDSPDNLNFSTRGLGITISAEDGQMEDVSEHDEPHRQAELLRLNPVGNNIILEQRFRLTDSLAVRIYSIGEISSFGAEICDYSLIKNTVNDSIIWIMSSLNSTFAGGSQKNYKCETEIKLGPGEYLARCITDGSHSYSAWNGAPPYDPGSWGLTILPAEDQNRESFELISGTADVKPLIAFNQVGNNVYFAQGFTLDRNASLRIKSLGSSNYSMTSFHDYAWIIDADTRRISWQMDFNNTEAGGGHEINRMFNGLVNLSAGKYILHYYSDGFHSSDSWIEAPPFEPDMWGVSVYSDGDEVDDLDQFSSLTYKPDNVLVSHRLVRNNANLKRKFEVKNAENLRIYAQGEGKYGNMSDYAWIENSDTKTIVWEMTYRNSVSGGGSNINRVFDRVVRFEPGEYELYYVSDTSHAYNDWKECPPNDPEFWGVTIFRNE